MQSLTWLFRLLILVLFLIWGSFFNFNVCIVFWVRLARWRRAVKQLLTWVVQKRSCVETLVILQAKFHVVSSPLSVLKIVLPLALHWKWFWPEKENTVNVKSGAFVVIMLLNKSLARVHSQKDFRLHFGNSFTLIWFVPSHTPTDKHCTQITLLKDCVKPRIQSASIQTHVNGRSGEASQSTKHFWISTAKELCSVLRNNWSRWGLVLKSSIPSHKKPWDPNWFKKTLFTPLTCRWAQLSTSDGLCTNTFSLAATVQIWALKRA